MTGQGAGSIPFCERLPTLLLRLHLRLLHGPPIGALKHGRQHVHAALPNAGAPKPLGLEEGTLGHARTPLGPRGTLARSRLERLFSRADEAVVVILIGEEQPLLLAPFVGPRGRQRTDACSTTEGNRSACRQGFVVGAVRHQRMLRSSPVKRGWPTAPK